MLAVVKHDRICSASTVPVLRYESRARHPIPASLAGREHERAWKEHLYSFMLTVIRNRRSLSHMNDVTRSRIEAQGFLGLDDRIIDELNYWLRLSPAICMIW